MRDANKLGDWLQIVSNVGIVVGLALVGLQMKQASDIAAAQLNSEYFLNTIDSYGLLAGEDVPAAWARAQMNAPDLSDTELSAVKYYLIRQWMLNVRVDATAAVGLGPAADSDGFVQGWINTLGNETALRWWEAEHDRVLEWVPSLRDAVDARLKASPASQRDAHRRLLEQMRSGPLPIPPAPQQP